MSQRTQRHNPFRRIGELFDASALGLVTLLLLAASFYATWQGLGDFVASRASGTGGETAAVGGAGAARTALVVLVVLTLTLAMYVALRETVNPIRKRNVLIAFPLYALLALWSVGFGYGFWWSLVAGQDATETALSETVASLSEETSGLRADLAAGAALMATAERLSEEKAARERERGGTCGVASGAGDGPLSRAREETRSQIAALSASVTSDWLDPMRVKLAELEGVKITGTVAGETTEARKQRMVALGRDVRRFAQDVSADATARGEILAVQMRAKAERLSVAPVSGVVDYCYDPDLATSLGLVANALEGPFDIAVAEFRFAEGVDGVAQAVEDLWLGVFGRLGLVERTSEQRFRLDGRSLIALMATIGVDLALFVFALLRGGMRRGYGGVPPSASTVIEHQSPVDGGGQAQDVIGHDKAKALPALEPNGEEPPEIRVNKLRQRVEADPRAVGIGSTDADSHSQIRDEEQVTDLIHSVDGRYRAMTPDEMLADKDAKIQELQAELDALKRRGYVATGRPGQIFDAKLHKRVGTQPSDLPEGTIIVTVKPGYITDGLNLYRMAEVIVSAGPNKFEF